MLQLIDGKAQSEVLKQSIANKVKNLDVKPRLIIISVGDDAASKIYIRNKRKACEETGIQLIVVEKPANVSRDEISDLIFEFNNDAFVDGIMIQEPLPAHLEGISEEIYEGKDVDGFTSSNLGKLLLQQDNYFEPCTPAGIVQLINSTGLNISGKHIVVIGRSKIVGKPLSAMLLNQNATVTICHSKTEHLKDICKTSDILISAIGKPKFITTEYIGPNTRIVTDVGINRLDNGKLCGDADFKSICQLFNNRINTNYITPVPGGVGPMTVQNLMLNTLKSYFNRHKNLKEE